MADEHQETSGLRRLERLVAQPQEALEVELKGWLDLDSREAQAGLAKALIALANTGGGFVVIGFTEQEGRIERAPEGPAALDMYTQDRIGGIVERYAEPTFHCEVQQVRRVVDGEVYPVIVVPGDHRVPIRAKRSGPDGRHLQEHTYYIRRPGPKSEAPQTGREWDELIGRCVRAARDDLLDAIRGVLTGGGAITTAANQEDALEAWLAESLARWDEVRPSLGPESQERARNGWYAVAYVLEGQLEASPPQLLEILRIVRGTETGWPAWIVMDGADERPQLRGNVIETTIEGGAVFPGDIDFWRADTSGRMFLVRGFDEDGGHSRREPGTAIDFVLPIWRVGEALLHPTRLAARLGDDGAAVDFGVIWHGLRGRHLVASQRRRLFHRRGPAQEDEVSSRIRVADVSRIPDELPEITRQLIAPLYWQFAFYEIEERVVVEELQEMRRG
ncbi:MAG: AlbA family DNA-binding domain-containing protein [Gaiellaceae bacterium]